MGPARPLLFGFKVRMREKYPDILMVGLSEWSSFTDQFVVC
jgi:hypothetical protein